jgi:hypothetical protein
MDMAKQWSEGFNRNVSSQWNMYGREEDLGGTALLYLLVLIRNEIHGEQCASICFLPGPERVEGG